MYAKFTKIVYPFFALLFAVELIFSIFSPEDSYNILFWETNIWAYRLYRLGALLVFAKLYLEQRKAEKLNSK